MKRFFFYSIFTLLTICAKAQIQGGFDCKDPDAWFDKEIYFVAYNGWTVSNGYSTYGQNVYNPVFLVNGKDIYYLSSGVWPYGSSISIDGTKMDKGTTVSLYVNNQLVYTWTCTESQPSIAQTSYRLYRDYRMLKRIMKLVRKIR